MEPIRLPHFVAVCFLMGSILRTVNGQSTDQLQNPFFANRDVPALSLFNRPQFQALSDAPREKLPDVDAHRIIAPIISPFMDIFDQMQENARARAQADKIARDRDDHPLSTSRSLFEMLQRLQRPTTTTTPQPPLIERILKPYIEPWQKQLDDFSKDVAGITFMPPTTTTTAVPTTTTTQNILEKSLAVFFPSLRRRPSTEAPVTTTSSPRFFDPNVFERLFFNRDKRQASPPPLLAPPPIFADWEKPILDAANPFTLNPYMKMFSMAPPSTLAPPPSIPDKLVHDPSSLPVFQQNPLKLQDPFYNPLFPNRKSKIFDLLAGGEAARILG